MIRWIVPPAALIGGYLLFQQWTSKGSTVVTSGRPSGPVGRFFSWDEFIRSGEAERQGIDNTPGPDAQRAIRSLVEHTLDPIRAAIGKPVRITSGYRSVAVNQAIGGASASQHMIGEAADIKVDGYAPEQLARFIRSLNLPVDQCIWYEPERGGQVHVSHTMTRSNRREYLHADLSGRYVPWV